MRAYAKINLGLRVLGKRPDGYHNIETVFHRIDLYDELTFQQAPRLSLVTDDPALPAGDANLCIKAGKLLLEQTGVLPANGVTIGLRKRIPVGAGLGGGSSDAATTLLGISELLGNPGSQTDLEQLAVRIGSDVPFFLRSGPAYATGRGEILRRMQFSVPYWIMIVYPDIHISTAWAYGAIGSPDSADHSRRPDHRSLDSLLPLFLNDPPKYAPMFTNDFEDAVFDHYPVVADVKKTLLRSGALFAQLSGSGSSVFALFPDQNSARHCAAGFDKKVRTFITPPGFHV